MIKTLSTGIILLSIVCALLLVLLVNVLIKIAVLVVMLLVIVWLWNEIQKPLFSSKRKRK